MSGLAVAIVEVPQRGARNAKNRKRATHTARLLRSEPDAWVGGTTPEPSRNAAVWKARNLIRHLTVFTDLIQTDLECATWEVASGPQAGQWRWAIRLRRP